MKKVLKILGIAVAVIVVIILIALGATSGLPKAADAFFQQVAAGDMEGAYYATSVQFRAATSPQDFAVFVEESGFMGYEKASWNNRSIENNAGTLEGTLSLQGGGQVPLKIILVKENEAWKILGIERMAAGI